MYPATPDFTQGIDQSAWWQIRRVNADGSQGLIVCSTSGRAFIDALQSMLGVAMDGKWGPATSTAVLSMIRALNADANLVSGVQAEATLRRVGPLSLRAAVWLTHAIQTIGDAPLGIALADINIPDGTIPPVWSVAPPFAPSRDAAPQCVAVGGAPAVDTSGTLPVIDTGNVDTTDMSPGTTISPVPGLPTGLPSVPLVQPGESTPIGVVVAVLAGLAVVGFLAWDVTKPNRSRRSR